MQEEERVLASAATVVPDKKKNQLNATTFLQHIDQRRRKEEKKSYIFSSEDKAKVSELLGLEKRESEMYGDCINIEGHMHGTCIWGKVILGSGYHTYKSCINCYMITGTVPPVTYSPYTHVHCAYKSPYESN